MTPTWPVTLACTAARAPGTMTPMTGTPKVRCASCRPAAVAVLQAMTTSFTLRCASHAPIWRTKVRISLGSRTP